MNHVGTVSRNSRYHRVFRGLRYPVLAGLLAASASAHATVNPDGLYVMSSSATGVKTGQYIEAAASARYQPYFGSTRLYTKAIVPVATSTIRRGALAALGAGVMHPGFQLAVAAAGLVITNYQIFAPGEVAPTSGTLDLESWNTVEPNKFYRHYQGQICPSNCEAQTPAQLAIKIFNASQAAGWNPVAIKNITSTVISIQTGCCTNGHAYNPVSGAGPEPIEITGALEPASPEDLETIDPFIEPQLYDELLSGGPIPVWQDEITVLGAPASYVQPTGDQAVAPEVATKLGQWAANAQASIDGVAEPYPETDAQAVTAQDKLLEDLDLDGPIPPFPGAEPEWQVETIDAMPSWSAGIGEATCPPPTVITLWSGLSFELPFQPLCDFAGFIRAVVIASAGIASLFIVLGRSS